MEVISVRLSHNKETKFCFYYTVLIQVLLTNTRMNEQKSGFSLKGKKYI